jgi:hypothetical protein
MRSMKRKVFPVLLIIVLMSCMACVADTAWRKATVTTYEIAGDGVGIAKDTAIVLNSQKVLTDAQLAKAKNIYNQAQKIYVAMGETLKLAGKAEDAVKKNELLAQYDALLQRFKALSIDIYTLVKDIKK